MSQSTPSDLRPHVFDPVAEPELFEGVLARRVVAFLIDVAIIAVPVILATIILVVFTVATLGIGGVLLWLLYPASVVWAVAYYGLTLGSPNSATIGMRVMDLEMRTWYGAPAYGVLGAAHAVVFWISVSALTPLILLVGLFNDRRRLLHDFLLGTVLINNAARTEALRSGQR